jgi:phospholipid-translocating ATPase
MKVGDIIKVH